MSNMDWNQFNDLPTAEKIQHVKRHGVKVKSEYELVDGESQPVVFSRFRECYFHYERPQSDDEYAVVWIHPDFSPDESVEAITEGDEPGIELLE